MMATTATHSADDGPDLNGKPPGRPAAAARGAEGFLGGILDFDDDEDEWLYSLSSNDSTKKSRVKDSILDWLRGGDEWTDPRMQNSKTRDDSTLLEEMEPQPRIVPPSPTPKTPLPKTFHSITEDLSPTFDTMMSDPSSRILSAAGTMHILSTPTPTPAGTAEVATPRRPYINTPRSVSITTTGSPMRSRSSLDLKAATGIPSPARGRRSSLDLPQLAAGLSPAAAAPSLKSQSTTPQSKTTDHRISFDAGNVAGHGDSTVRQAASIKRGGVLGGVFSWKLGTPKPSARRDTHPPPTATQTPNPRPLFSLSPRVSHPEPSGSHHTEPTVTTARGRSSLPRHSSEPNLGPSISSGPGATRSESLSRIPSAVTPRRPRPSSVVGSVGTIVVGGREATTPVRSRLPARSNSLSRIPVG